MLLIPRRKERYSILQCGINKYPSSPLEGCVNDMEQLWESASRLKWAASNRRVLIDGDATRKAIEEGLAWLMRQNTQLLMFQFSGHGTLRRDQNADEQSGIDGAICPVDYARNGAIADDAFGAMADGLRSGQRLILFFDSCYSGAAQRGTIAALMGMIGRRTRYRFVRTNAVMPSDKYYDPTTNTSFNNERSILIATAQPNVLAADAWIAGRYRGAGTHALMTAWEKLGGRATYEDIVTTANVWLGSNGYGQRIMYGGLRYHFGRAFLT